MPRKSGSVGVPASNPWDDPAHANPATGAKRSPGQPGPERHRPVGACGCRSNSGDLTATTFRCLR